MTVIPRFDPANRNRHNRRKLGCGTADDGFVLNEVRAEPAKLLRRKKL